MNEVFCMSNWIPVPQNLLWVATLECQSANEPCKKLTHLTERKLSVHSLTPSQLAYSELRTLATCRLDKLAINRATPGVLVQTKQNHSNWSPTSSRRKALVQWGVDKFIDTVPKMRDGPPAAGIRYPSLSILSMENACCETTTLSYFEKETVKLRDVSEFWGWKMELFISDINQYSIVHVSQRSGGKKLQVWSSAHWSLTCDR